MRIFNKKEDVSLGERHIILSMDLAMVVHYVLVSDQPCHKEGCLNLAIQAIGGLICLRNL